MNIERYEVEENKIVRCERIECRRILYPGDTYVVVSGEEIPDGPKKLCEDCLLELGWDFAKRW